jgi:hypothetical protein
MYSILKFPDPYLVSFPNTLLDMAPVCPCARSSYRLSELDKEEKAAVNPNASIATATNVF